MILYFTHSSSDIRVPDELLLHQREIPEGPDIQLEELDKGLQYLLSLQVPRQQSFTTRFAFFTSLSKSDIVAQNNIF